MWAASAWRLSHGTLERGISPGERNHGGSHTVSQNPPGIFCSEKRRLEEKRNVRNKHLR